MFLQVGLFWGILCGQVEERIYHIQCDVVENLWLNIKNFDPRNSGFVSIQMLEKFIREVFPVKPQEHVTQLLQVAHKAIHGNDPSLIKYSLLFGKVNMRYMLVSSVKIHQMIIAKIFHVFLL